MKANLNNFAFNINIRFFNDTSAQQQNDLPKMRKLYFGNSNEKNVCDEESRDIRDFEISIRCTASIGKDLEDTSSDRIPLTEEIDSIQSDLAEYQEAGLDYLVITRAGDSTEQVVESVSKFTSEIVVDFL